MSEPIKLPGTFGLFPCGHRRTLSNRKGSLYVATACAVCAGSCSKCGHRKGLECGQPGAWPVRSHAQRLKAHGITMVDDMTVEYANG